MSVKFKKALFLISEFRINRASGLYFIYMLKNYLAYLNDNPKGYWFKAKLYGWGWVPVTWQGWLIILVYLLAIMLFSWTLDKNSPPRDAFFTFILPIFLLTMMLICVCYKYGEKPHWQWGIPKDKK